MKKPSRILENYRGEENDRIVHLVKWNILQYVGQIKKYFFRQDDLIINRKFAHVGCGGNVFPNFVNIDCHTTQSIFSFGLDQIFRWDLRNRLPFRENTFEGVFSEHCMEHLNPWDSYSLLFDIFRVLQPGGVVRIIVPDAEKYVEFYNRRRAGSDTTDMAEFNSWQSGAEALRGLTCYLGHYTLFDFELLRDMCLEVGFCDITRSSFGISKVKELNKDAEDRAWNSLYLEAKKPLVL